jgi:hypothetical protein
MTRRQEGPMGRGAEPGSEQREAAAMSSGEIHPEVRPGVHQGVRPEVHRCSRPIRRIARRGADPGGAEKLRSPRHIEADS